MCCTNNRNSKIFSGEGVHLAEVLRSELERKDMTVPQLAELADVPRKSIEYWLDESKFHGLINYKKVSAALNLTLYYFFFGQIESVVCSCPGGNPPKPCSRDV